MVDDLETPIDFILKFHEFSEYGNSFYLVLIDSQLLNQLFNQI